MLRPDHRYHHRVSVGLLSFSPGMCVTCLLDSMATLLLSDSLTNFSSLLFVQTQRHSPFWRLGSLGLERTSSMLSLVTFQTVRRVMSLSVHLEILMFLPPSPFVAQHRHKARQHYILLTSFSLQSVVPSMTTTMSYSLTTWPSML